MTDIAKEYGAALFMLAKEANAVDAFADSLAVVETAFQSEPDYERLLSLPNVPREERVNLLDEAFSGAIDDTVLSFLKLLCEEGYMTSFADAKAEFSALLDDDKRISHAEVTSAVPLTDGEKQTLINRLQAIGGRTVVARYHIDASLLGGVVVEMEGNVYDGSLKHQMNRIKDVIDA